MTPCGCTWHHVSLSGGVMVTMWHRQRERRERNGGLSRSRHLSRGQVSESFPGPIVHPPGDPLHGLSQAGGVLPGGVEELRPNCEACGGVRRGEVGGIEPVDVEGDVRGVADVLHGESDGCSRGGRGRASKRGGAAGWSKRWSRGWLERRGGSASA